MSKRQGEKTSSINNKSHNLIYFPNWYKPEHVIVLNTTWSRIINAVVNIYLGWLLILMPLHSPTFSPATFLCNSAATLSDCFVIPASVPLMCYKKGGDAPGASLAAHLSSCIMAQVNRWRRPEVSRVNLYLLVESKRCSFLYQSLSCWEALSL